MAKIFQIVFALNYFGVWHAYAPRARRNPTITPLSTPLRNSAGWRPPNINATKHGSKLTLREAIMALLYLKTLPREHLDALLEDPAYLENL